MASQRSQPAVPINSRKKNVPSNVLLKKKLHTLSTQVLVGAIFRIVGGVERVEVEGKCTLITKRRKQGENKARACESKPFCGSVVLHFTASPWPPDFAPQMA